MCFDPYQNKRRGWRCETGLSTPVKYFTDRSKAVLLLWIFLCYLYLVFAMLLRLSIAALRSPAGKGLTSSRLFVKSNCDCVIFPCGILGQVWYLIVLIPDFCTLTYFHKRSELICTQRCFNVCCTLCKICYFSFSIVLNM